MHPLLSNIALAQYEDGSFSRTGAILTSDSEQSYLDTLATQDLLASRTAGIVAQIKAAQVQADAARESAQTLLSDARATRDALAAKREKVISETARFHTLLASLTAAQQLRTPPATRPPQRSYRPRTRFTPATLPPRRPSTSRLRRSANPTCGPPPARTRLTVQD